MTFADLLTTLGYNPADLDEAFTIRVCRPGEAEFGGDFLTSDDLDRYTVTDYDPALDADWCDGWCKEFGHDYEFLIESV